MAWTTPRTWADGELVTASIMNTHVRDQLNYLNNERGQGTEYDSSAAAAYSTTSTSDVLINAVFTEVITIASTRAKFFLAGSFACLTGPLIVSLYVDGVATRELARSTVNSPVLFVAHGVLTGLTPGSRTFDVRWRVTAGSATLSRGGSNVNTVGFVVTEY